MKRYHYVYRITNIIENKHYYGKRSSKIVPSLDLGIIYFSSSKIVKSKIKEYGVYNFKFKVLKIFSSAKDAIEFESKIHIRMDVKNNELFYNLVNQSSSKFDTTGKGYYKNTLSGCYEFIDFKDKKKYHVGCMFGINKGENINHHFKNKSLYYNKIDCIYKWLCNDDLIDNSIWIKTINENINKVICKDINGIVKRVSKSEFKNNDNLISINKNKIVVFNKQTNENIRIDKELFDDKIHIGITKGRCVYFNTETDSYEMVDKNDKRIGITLFKNSFNKAPYLNTKTNIIEMVDKNDKRIGTELISVHKNTSTYKNIHTDKTERLLKNDNRIGVDYVGVKAKKVKCINDDNDILFLYKIDNRLKTGEFKIFKGE